MAYVLVMGGLALSVSFTLGWLVWRSARGLRGLLAGSAARGKAPPRASRGKKAQAPRRATSARKPAARKAAGKPAKNASAEPWGLTRWLARRHSALPLFLLAGLLYGTTRLVEFGMTRRPQSPPAGYHDLVNALGWLAAGLLALALLNLMARWRCARGQTLKRG